MNEMMITVDGASRGVVQHDGMVRFNPDSTLNTMFYKKSVVDPRASREHNRPIYFGVEYVRIQHAGETDYVDRPALDSDRARFPRQWEAYQKGQTPIPPGTPVDLLFPGSPEIGQNLHANGVHTAEQLAGLNDHGLQTVGMGATIWKQRAKDFLDSSKGTEGFHRLQQQLDDAKLHEQVLQNQLTLLKTQVDHLLAQVKQGIPASMVPQVRPTQAQAVAMQPEMLNPPVSSAPMFEIADEFEVREPEASSIEPRRGSRKN